MLLLFFLSFDRTPKVDTDPFEHPTITNTSTALDLTMIRAAFILSICLGATTVHGLDTLRNRSKCCNGAAAIRTETKGDVSEIYTNNGSIKKTDMIFKSVPDSTALALSGSLTTFQESLYHKLQVGLTLDATAISTAAGNATNESEVVLNVLNGSM